MRKRVLSVIREPSMSLDHLLNVADVNIDDLTAALAVAARVPADDTTSHDETMSSAEDIDQHGRQPPTLPEINRWTMLARKSA